ncbi:hypothetical protein BSKO_04269 [Bryopsis sp. KO-2023]|nr:hypothetical protein BSKO_04269 [Bryopsis sp. KO-2023]
MHLGWILRDALHQRAAYFCCTFVRGKKWRPKSLDVKDHTRYEQYLKKWQRRRSKQQLWSLADEAAGDDLEEEEEQQQRSRPSAPHFNANADYFYHDFFEDDVSQRRRQTFENSKDSAMREQAFQKRRMQMSSIQGEWANFSEEWEDAEDDHDQGGSRNNGSSSPGQQAVEGIWSHLRVLGLPFDAKLTARRLKEAFHMCARKWHPDLHQGSDKSEAEVRFKEAHTAYQSLMVQFSK